LRWSSLFLCSLVMFEETGVVCGLPWLAVSLEGDEQTGGEKGVV